MDIGEFLSEWGFEIFLILAAAAGFYSGISRYWKGKSEITCEKCGAGLDPVSNLVPETGELVCLECGHRQKKSS